MRDISISNKLQVLPSNFILIPGCEPTSTVTSTEMFAQMREAGVCTSAIISLDDALALIPGAKIVLQQNFGPPTHKLFELPQNLIDCPCNSYEDYYQILRDGATPVTENDIDDICDSSCGTLSRGVLDQCFCRAPGT